MVTMEPGNPQSKLNPRSSGQFRLTSAKALGDPANSTRPIHEAETSLE